MQGELGVQEACKKYYEKEDGAQAETGVGLGNKQSSACCEEEEEDDKRDRGCRRCLRAQCHIEGAAGLSRCQRII